MKNASNFRCPSVRSSEMPERTLPDNLDIDSQIRVSGPPHVDLRKGILFIDCAGFTRQGERYSRSGCAIRRLAPRSDAAHDLSRSVQLVVSRRFGGKNFELLKSNPKHPSLHFKRIGKLWSARVGEHHRALRTTCRRA